MPSSRQYRVLGFVAILALLVVYYVANGAHNTHESPFYKSTIAALGDRKDAEARKDVLTEENSRLERVERLRQGHDDVAAEAIATATPTPPQPPLFVAKPEDAATEDAADDDGTAAAEKSVAGRKKMKDDKVVHGRPGNDAADGVAKVGNVAPQVTDASRKPVSESKEDAAVKAELDDILKKGPIIVFSKTYCPYSKKAKHILLDLYQITPRPYVVELDNHPLGPELQDALQRVTGRRTVPNVLVNGRSIGGGDDLEALHVAGTLIETVQAMGGKRIMSALTAEAAAAAAAQG